MSFDYSYVLPPTGPAQNEQVREMFDDVKAYVNTLISGGGTGAPNNASFVTITNDTTLTDERALSVGSGLSLTDNGAGSTVELANTGVLSLSTTNVNSSFNHSSGAITFSFSPTPTFSSLIFQSGTGAIGIAPSATSFTSYNLTLPLDTGTSGYLLSTDGSTPTATLSWVAPATVKAITGTTDQISVDDSGDPIVLSAPQDIATTSSPTFAALSLGDTLGSAFPLTFGGTLDGIGHDTNITKMSGGTGTASIEELGSSILGSFNLFTVNGGVSSSYIRITDATSNYIYLQAASMAADLTLTLPAVDGSANDVLVTDGSGNLSFVSVSSVSGAANVALSNLSSVAINTTLVSDTDNTDDLGTSSIAWKDIFLKGALKSGATTLATVTEIGYLGGVNSSIQTQLGLKAALAGAAFTGAVTVASGTANPVTITAAATAGSGAGLILNNTTSGGGVCIEFRNNSSVIGFVGTVAAINGGSDLSTAIIANTGQAVKLFSNGSSTASLVVRASDGSVAFVGTTTNDSATAGNVGEYVESVVGSTAGPTSGQYKDLTSISLTAGDWDVTIVGRYDNNGATSYGSRIGISTTSGNSGSGLTVGSNTTDIGQVNAAIGTAGGVVSNYRMSLSATTTVYFKWFSSHATATPTMAGRLSARRVR